MALYIPAGRRKRRLVLVALAALALGLVLGAAAGRASAPTAADQAAEAKQKADTVAGQLQALTIHYDQVAKGEITKASFQASLDAGLARAQSDLDVAMAQAPWLDAKAKDALRAEVQGVSGLAARDAPAAEFDAAVAHAATSIKVAFGAAPS
jgi:hypothetical protein